jgi:hypothetical protein
MAHVAASHGPGQYTDTFAVGHRADGQHIGGDARNELVRHVAAGFDVWQKVVTNDENGLWIHGAADSEHQQECSNCEALRDPQTHQSAIDEQSGQNTNTHHARVLIAPQRPSKAWPSGL